ncbi:diamine acetyltransferase 1-like [Babylonia areolata]|uniref:diamine acetyltransferase 1-like n=1 Tax=Babylonia areolata TaxID=304850 RepID=UPI003FD173F7
MATHNVKVREARENDCEELMRMIKALAEYEHNTDPLVVTANDLKRDAFGEKPFFYAFVAELIPEGGGEEEGGGRPLVGYVMYHYSYNFFFGRTCFMRDFYVDEPWRRKGAGSAMLAKVVQTAQSQRCVYVEWIALNWNQPSIAYYKRRGARDVTTKEGWLLFRLEKSAMESFLTSPPAPRDAP